VEVVGYLLEELRDAKNYALFQTDVQTANIFIGSLIFIEELAEKVRRRARRGRPAPARLQAARPPRRRLTWPRARAQIVETVTPVRDQLDACLVFPSMPAVMCAARARAARGPGVLGRRMHALGPFSGGALTRGTGARRRLNKLGTFNLAQLGQSKSPFAEFMRAQRKSNENFEESLLKLVRTLPAVLKYLPSEKAQVPGRPRSKVQGRACASRALAARAPRGPPARAGELHAPASLGGARARALPQAAVRARRTRARSCRACSTGSAAMRPTWRACC